jgi:hypothetical protein
MRSHALAGLAPAALSWSCLLPLWLMLFVDRVRGLNFTVAGGQIFTPGLAILDAPQPGTPLGGGGFRFLFLLVSVLSIMVAFPTSRFPCTLPGMHGGRRN